MHNYSFLMCVYLKDKPEYLVQALESMINQTLKPNEIVIVKDGALTEQLETTIQGYVNKYPKLFNIVSNESNLGLGMSLNKGLKACKNELVARMDADDVCYLDRCEKQIKAFSNDNELVLVGAYVSEFNKDINNIVSIRKVPTKLEEIRSFSKRRSAFNHPVVMYKKSKVQEVGGYSDLRRNQDVDLFGRMVFADYKVSNIPELLLYFRTDDNLAKRRKSWENSRSYISVIFNQYKKGFSSLLDFSIVAVMQIGMFCVPVELQHFFYKSFLRN